MDGLRTPRGEKQDRRASRRADARLEVQPGAAEPSDASPPDAWRDLVRRLSAEREMLYERLRMAHTRSLDLTDQIEMLRSANDDLTVDNVLLKRQVDVLKTLAATLTNMPSWTQPLATRHLSR